MRQTQLQVCTKGLLGTATWCEHKEQIVRWMQFYLHSSWGCCFSYFSLMWDTPKSGCNQWRASECRWVRRRPREDTQRSLWISAIFWMTPCWISRRKWEAKRTMWRWTQVTSVCVSYPDICSISMPDITGPGAWFAICLKVVEDLENPVHGARRPLEASSRAAGANTRTTRHPGPGFNPTTTRCRVIKVGLQVGRWRHAWLKRSCWG